MDRGNHVRPLAISLTVLGAVARLLPHPPNFAPVGGMSLYAGARLRGWQALALPLVLMLVTDPLLGGYSAATPLIYLSFMINVWIGRRLQSTESPWRIGAACLICSAQFFLLSNFGVWLGGLYPHTLAGLGLCYTAAIPFFGRTLGADILYSAVLFGLHAWLSRTVLTAERVPATA
ncbi:MAG TPA: DUF6580 family putative transport protein [Bryobacteraceae bacterium]|nr:DUF6580 family putative transport protein [Bryobacteraceae bacterium]